MSEFYNGNSNTFAYTLGTKSGVQGQMNSFKPNPGGLSSYGYGQTLPTTSIYKQIQANINSIKAALSQFISNSANNAKSGDKI